MNHLRPPTESNLLISLVFSSFLAAPVVHVCTDEPTAVAELARLVRLGQLVPGCVGEQVVRFAATGSGVQLRLEAAGGSLTRAVPWLESTEQPLGRSALADRLRALGVLLDALLLEHQLATPEPAVAPPRPAPEGPPARVRPRRKPMIPLEKAAPPTEPPPPPVFDPGPAPAPEPPPILSLAPATEALSVPAIPTPPTPPPTPRAQFWGGVHLGGRYRTPDLLVPQAWLLLGHRALRLGVGWQPSIQWAWDGRTLSTQTWSVGLGALLPLTSGEGWHLRAPLGILAELTRVERLDLDGARHTLGQLGLEGGVSFALKLSDLIWLTTDGLGRWLPLGTLDIDAGPTVPFNRAGFEIGLGLAIAPGW